MPQKYSAGNDSPLPSPKANRRGDEGVNHSVPKSNSKANLKGSGKDVFPPSKYEPSPAARTAPKSNKPEDGGRKGVPSFGKS